MDYPVKIPAQLRPLLVGFRKAAGLTQAEVAARLGVTQQTYAQLEAKPEAASMGRLFDILAMLKVSIVLAQTAESIDEAKSKANVGKVKLPATAGKIALKKREDW